MKEGTAIRNIIGQIKLNVGKINKKPAMYLPQKAHWKVRRYVKKSTIRTITMIVLNTAIKITVPSVGCAAGGGNCG